jgi:hypothetical protein
MMAKVSQRANSGSKPVRNEMTPLRFLIIVVFPYCYQTAGTITNRIMYLVAALLSKIGLFWFKMTLRD